MKDFIKGVRRGFGDTCKSFSEIFGFSIWHWVLSSIFTVVFTILIIIDMDYIILMIPILMIIYIIVIAYVIHKNE